MKLVVLPYGQHILQDQTVNFPVNTSEVGSSLPKILNSARIVLIVPPGQVVLIPLRYLLYKHAFLYDVPM